jgi:hypothetical protein
LWLHIRQLNNDAKITVELLNKKRPAATRVAAQLRCWLPSSSEVTTSVAAEFAILEMLEVVETGFVPGARGARSWPAGSRT